MKYKLSFENATYPVDHIQIRSESTHGYYGVGRPVSFVSPIRLNVGMSYRLLGDSTGYQLLVKSCSGFTNSLPCLVSGTIAAQEHGAGSG